MFEPESTPDLREDIFKKISKLPSVKLKPENMIINVGDSSSLVSLKPPKPFKADDLFKRRSRDRLQRTTESVQSILPDIRS